MYKMTARQVAEDLDRRRKCPGCGQRYHSKSSGTTTVHTLFGLVAVPNPRWSRCACQTNGPNTFRPTSAWLTGHTSPELLYLETRWASLIPFAKVADLLKEVLPVAPSTNHGSVAPRFSSGKYAIPNVAREPSEPAGHAILALLQFLDEFDSSEHYSCILERLEAQHG